MAQKIYVDPGVTTNPSLGAGMPSNPYNHLGQVSQPGSATDLEIYLARDNIVCQSNVRFSGTQSGRVDVLPWEQYDGRTQRPAITNMRLVNITWTRGTLTRSPDPAPYTYSWSANPSGNVWACPTSSLPSGTFYGKCGPNADYPEGKWLVRRNTDNAGNPQSDYDQPLNAHYQWGFSSNNYVCVYSAGGVNPATRYGQFYMSYLTSSADGGTGSRLIYALFTGGLRIRGLRFENLGGTAIRPYSRAGTASAPCQDIWVWDNEFMGVYDCVYPTGVGSFSTLATTDAHLDVTSGFSNMLLWGNRAWEIGRTFFSCDGTPALNGCRIFNNTILKCCDAYGWGAIYVAGGAHTTDGGWIKVYRNYIDDVWWGAVWENDGRGLYNEDRVDSVWFDSNIVVDTYNAITFSGVPRKGRATRNWLINRDRQRGGFTTSSDTAFAITVFNGGTAPWNFWANSPTLIELDQNVIYNIPQGINSGSVGFDQPGGATIKVRNNVYKLPTHTGSMTCLLNTKDANAKSHFDPVGNWCYGGSGSGFWTQNWGASYYPNSDLKGLVTTDPQAIIDPVLNMVAAGKDAIWAARDNPAMRLPACPPQMLAANPKSGLMLLS